MAAPLYGRVKRGDDRSFAPIVVTYQGAPQDLTADGWSVLMQARRFESSPTAITFHLDQTELASSRVVPSLTHEQTAAAEIGTWVCDVQVTGPAGISSSLTMRIEIVADVTRPEPTP